MLINCKRVKLFNCSKCKIDVKKVKSTFKRSLNCKHGYLKLDVFLIPLFNRVRLLQDIAYGTAEDFKYCRSNSVITVVGT